jgi:hypothetical protein
MKTFLIVGLFLGVGLPAAARCPEPKPAIATPAAAGAPTAPVTPAPGGGAAAPRASVAPATAAPGAVVTRATADGTGDHATPTLETLDRAAGCSTIAGEAGDYYSGGVPLSSNCAPTVPDQ